MTGVIASLPKFQFSNALGLPMSGGTLTSYLAGTTTPATTYQDQALSTANTNPIAIDSRGECTLWLDSTKTYKFVLKNAAGVIQWTVDNITNAAAIAAALDALLRADLAEPTGAARVGYMPAGVGVVGTNVQSKLRESVSIHDFKNAAAIAGDWATSLQAADAYSISTGLSLKISGQLPIATPLTFSGKSNWVFEGSSGTLASDTPTSYFVKKATVAGDLLTFTAGGVRLENPAIVGEVGNTGCGITLLGNSPEVTGLYVTKMGSHGLRIGSDSTGYNMNSFNISNPRCIGNLGNGIHLNDGSINANAGLIHKPICTQNGGHGFYGNKAALGVTIICPTFEANTGYGAYLDVFFGYIGANVIIGGDIEANTAGNVFESVKYQTVFVGVSVQGKTWNSASQAVAWTPVLTSSGVAGTYVGLTTQGVYTISGGSVYFSATITYTSNSTATGQPYIELPVPCYGSTPNPDFSLVQAAATGFALGAGNQMCGLINRTGNRIQIHQTNGATLSATNIPNGEVTLYVSGSYMLNIPNYYIL